MTQVMNLTDVDDKTIRGAVAEGLPLARVHRPVHRDASSRTSTTPERRARPSVYPRATDHVPEMVEHHRRSCTERGHTYERDGSVYFRIASFPGYGKLSRHRPRARRGAARASPTTSTRRRTSATSPSGRRRSRRRAALWESPLGPGRPGWHIECSAMSMKYLGETLRHPHRRRRQHLPAPRERDRAERGGDGEAVRRRLAARRAPDRRRREDGEVEGQLLHARRRPRAGQRPGRASATCSSRCPTGRS